MCSQQKPDPREEVFDVSSSLLAYLYICIMILPNMLGIDVVLLLTIILSSQNGESDRYANMNIG